MEITKNYLTIKDLMRIIGVSRGTIYNMRIRGDLQFRKLNGRPVVTREEYKRFDSGLPVIPAEPGPFPQHLRKSA